MPLSVRQGLRFCSGNRCYVDGGKPTLSSFYLRVKFTVTLTAYNDDFRSHIVGRRNNSAGWNIAVGGNSSQGMVMFIEGGGTAITSADSIPLGIPTDVEVIANGSNISIYINGKQSGQGIMASWTNNNADTVYLGARRDYPGGQYYLDGILHSLSISTDTATVLSYNLNEGQGTTAYDTSGNGNHGTISGATWVIKKAPTKLKKNMLQTSDYAVNGPANPQRTDFTTGLVQGGTYTLSGVFSIFADDDTTADRVTIQFFYADGTSNTINNGISNQIRDGVERFISITGTANPAKVLTAVRLYLFDYTATGTKMHRTARQVQLEQGQLTAFEPYIGFPDLKPAPTKPKKNMLPPFTDNRWTLHENTRMKQANFAGKVAGSTVENPHLLRAVITANTIVAAPGGAEPSQVTIDNSTTLNGASWTTSRATLNDVSQHILSFNLIEHVLRNYGADVFGTAVTVADRVAWLKANIAKLTCNWHGYGSGPAGNKATFWKWVSGAWKNEVYSHSNGTVTKLSNSAIANVLDMVQSDGFVHYIAYAEASDGVTASTINTDFVELEIVMAKGSIPQPDYSLTLNTTAGFNQTDISLPALPNTQYTVSGNLAGSGARIYVHPVDGAGVEGTALSFITETTPFVTMTSLSNTVKLRVKVSNTVAGLFTFTNPQLEPGDVATDFEPYIPVPDNKPAPMKPKKNMLQNLNSGKWILTAATTAIVRWEYGFDLIDLPANSKYYRTIPIDVEPNTDYTLSCRHNGRMAVYTVSSTGSPLAPVPGAGYTTNQVSQFNTGPETRIFAIFGNAGVLTGMLSFDDLQLEPGSVKTPFEPYTLVPDNKPVIR